MTRTIVLRGLVPLLVQVTAAHVGPDTALVIEGLREASVRESRVRVGAALQQCKINAGGHTVRIEAPIPLSGGGADLAMALAIARPASVETYYIGELSLTGALRPVRGVHPMLAMLGPGDRAVIPWDNRHEATLAIRRGVQVFAAQTIQEVLGRVETLLPAPGDAAVSLDYVATPGELDLSDVRGQYSARRALEIAAAGGFNVLFEGPAGAGKTMLARRLTTILPAMTLDEIDEATAVHSVAGLLGPARPWVRSRPFRAPHHTVSTAGLVGGGDPIRPGEVSLAQHGVLFLDELHEFRGACLDSLRCALRDGAVSLSRTGEKVSFPAEPVVVGSLNRCYCGHYGDGSGRCECSAEQRKSHAERVAPLRAMFDIVVQLPAISVADLQNNPRGETSAVVRARVEAAQARAATAAAYPATVPPDDGAIVALDTAEKRLGLNSAACGRVMRIARVIADLDDRAVIIAADVAEAVLLAVP